MWNQALLSLLSLFNSLPGQSFQEVSVNLPAGVSTISSGMEWNGVSIASKDESPLPKIWYQRNNKWVAWHNFEEADQSTNETLLELLFAGNLQKDLIIKSESPANITAHFFNTQIENESLVARFDPFDDDTYDDPRTGLARTQNGPKFVSRSEWGANESLRVWKPLRGIKKFFRSSVPESNLVARTFRPKIIQKNDKKGQKLTWPVEENTIIEKFVIHHTGEYIDEKRDPKELMRAIYYFHTISRGWGDIGYNYVIDAAGNIYEGRVGGPKTVGAHTAYHNLGSVGISLMGNFQTEKPTDAQMKVLTLLLADHAKRFRINPLGESYFLHQSSKNISGHRDVAKKGHGTACPGNNLHSMLPQLRTDVANLVPQLNKQKKQKTTRDFLTKSKAAPRFQKRVLRNTQKLKPLTIKNNLKKRILSRGESSHFEIKVQNGTAETWKRGEKFLVKDTPDGLKIDSFRLTETLPPGRTGVFRAKAAAISVPNGNYVLSLVPQIYKIQNYETEESFPFPIQISGDLKNLTQKPKPSKLIRSAQASSFRTTAPKSKKTVSRSPQVNFGPEIKVKLSYFDQNYVELKANKQLTLSDLKQKSITFKASEIIKIRPLGQNKNFEISSASLDENLVFQNPQFKTEGIITLLNYDRKLGRIKYNQFRNQINVISGNGKSFSLVNQLPMELYLRGLSEEPKTEPEEKKHAIFILARSYALVYSGTKRKFGTPLYDLEDSPATSQYYLGYEWEKYHQDQITLLEKTKGKVITINQMPVIGPYFTQSSGHSSDKWSKQYPWAKVQPLPYDKGLEQRGHGVGLSGNTSRALAKIGKSYDEILKYFFEGITVKEVY